jgi:hypothetical protein
MIAFRSAFERAQSDLPPIFLLLLRETCFRKIFKISLSDENNHRVRHKKLSIESLKNQLSTFLDEKIHGSNLFCVFLKTSFSCTAPNGVKYNPPLTSSDRAEIFTTDTLRYLPELKSTVLISDARIQLYRILKVRKSVLAKTFGYFFYKKKKVRSLENLKATSEIWL